MFMVKSRKQTSSVIHVSQKKLGRACFLASATGGFTLTNEEQE